MHTLNYTEVNGVMLVLRALREALTMKVDFLAMMKT